MSDAVWGFFGVAVGAIVTFLVTWWQMKEAGKREDLAHQRERERLRTDAEREFLLQLGDLLEQWAGGLVAGSMDGQDDMRMVVSVNRLKGRARDEKVREAIAKILAARAFDEDGQMFTSSERVDLFVTRHHEAQNRINERLRALDEGAQVATSRDS